jgi:hypothetical protein
MKDNFFIICAIIFNCTFRFEAKLQFDARCTWMMPETFLTLLKCERLAFYVTRYINKNETHVSYTLNLLKLLHNLK